MSQEEQLPEAEEVRALAQQILDLRGRRADLVRQLQGMGVDPKDG